MSEWQPISTAPKDGTVILLALAWETLAGFAPSVRDKKQIAVGYYDGWWETGVPGGHSAGGGNGQFTHWQPLPNPPKKDPVG